MAALEAKSLDEGLGQPRPVQRQERESRVTLGMGPGRRSWQRATSRLALVAKRLKQLHPARMRSVDIAPFTAGDGINTTSSVTVAKTVMPYRGLGL